MPNPLRIVQKHCSTQSYTPLEFQTLTDLACELEIPWVRIPEAPRLQGNWGTMEEMSQAQGIRVARVLGIPIYVDFSWILVFGLITFTISGNFAAQHPTWTGTQTWTVGLLTTLLFFSSVVFPKNPMIGALGTFLGQSNLWLAGFNLLPGFPLDGGRIFRAIVWGTTKDFTRATQVAGSSGKMIASAMIVVGIGSFASERLATSLAVLGLGRWDGAWFVLIGWYLLNAAQASVTQVTIRGALAGLSATDVMSQEVPTIPANMSLEEYGNEVLRTGRRMHIVTMYDRLVGLMNVAALIKVARDEWNMNSVQAVMVPRDKIIWASPEESLQRLLERLLAADVNQMPVVSHGEDGSAHIVGIVTRDAILRVIQTRSELGAALGSR